VDVHRRDLELADLSGPEDDGRWGTGHEVLPGCSGRKAGTSLAPERYLPSKDGN
jgi:hypothetical protein